MARAAVARVCRGFVGGVPDEDLAGNVGAGPSGSGVDALIVAGASTGREHQRGDRQPSPGAMDA
jgi:hypothetical protein